MRMRGMRRVASRAIGVAVMSASLLVGHPIGAAAEAACGYTAATPLTRVGFPGIREASALVASEQWPGVYWTLNDSKNTPTVFAFDDQGRARGAFQVAGATNVDWEAMQLGPDGAGGTALYIGDIGDNERNRMDAVIYRIAEPEPAAPGVQAARVTEPAAAFHIRFPVGDENAETMLVHPRTGEILIFSRATSGYSLAYSLPMLTDGEHTLVPEFVDIVDVRQYESSQSPISGLVTDGAVSADGRHVVLRTYTSALVYDLAEGAPLSSITTQEPRVYPLADGPKGEGITFRADGADLLTIGEGTPAVLFEAANHC